MRRLRSLSCVGMGVVAAGALAAALMPASAFAQGQTANWVSYGAAPAGSTVHTVQGRADGKGGCTIDLASSLQPGETEVRGDEIAFSANTCQSQVAITSGAAAAPAPADPTNADVASSGGLVSSQGAAATGSKTTASPAVALTTYHSAGYAKTWYTDPIGLVVNSVQNGTNWYYNYSCVTSASGSYNYTWLSASGWSLQGNNWSNTFTCTQTTSSSYAHFHNGIFCAFNATDIYYNRNNVHGLYNGVLNGNVSATKSGGCTGLLSFHFQLKRTLN